MDFDPRRPFAVAPLSGSAVEHVTPTTERVRYSIDRTVDGRIRFELLMREELWSHLAGLLLSHGSEGPCGACHELGMILRTKATGERNLPAINVPLAGDFLPGT